jgi:thiol-disulfide isomerase/thioredoxin
MLANLFSERRSMALLAIAAIAGLIGGVYVSIAVYSKNQPVVTAECAETPTIATRVEPFARGELAAFRVADTPEYLANIGFLDPAGNETSLAAFAGHTILVNLWATWCVPCRLEMPALNNLETSLGGDAFEVVAINIDLGDPARAQAFLDEFGINQLDFYADPTAAIFSDLKKRGLAFGLPVTLLIDGTGCRIGSVNGPAEWDSESAEMLINAAIGAG